MTHPDNSPHIFQWHVEGSAGPIGWVDVHGTRTYQYWSPMADVLAGPGDQSIQTWSQFCDELELPDEVRNLYNADAPVKSWDQLTHDLALPEEWGFRTQFTVGRLADDANVSERVVGRQNHTLDAGFERGGDKGEPSEGRTGAREVHFNRQAHWETIAGPTGPLAAPAAETGRQPSELVTDLDLSGAGVTLVCTRDIPSRLDELDLKVRQRVDPKLAQDDPKAAQLQELIARVELLSKQSLDAEGRPQDRRYRDGESGGIVPDYNPDGSLRYDDQILGPHGEILSNRQAWSPVLTGEQAQQMQVEEALKQATRGELSDSARHELIDRAREQQQLALRDMQKAHQDQDYEAAKARFDRASRNEAKLKQNWDGPSQGQPQQL